MGVRAGVPPEESLIAQGLEHHRRGDLEPAAQLYARALETAPGHCEALHLSGVLAQQQGDFAGSVALIKAAIAAAPKGGVARHHANLANAFNQLGRTAEAEASAREALRLDPKAVAAHGNLGVALRAQQRFEAAAACFRTATTLHPGYAEGFANLGLVLSELGRLAEAEGALRRAVALNPDGGEGWANLGAVLLRGARWEEAASSLERAVALSPRLADAQANLAAAYKAQGRLEAAADRYRTAADVAPESAVILQNLGLVLADLHRFEQATATFEAAAALDPRNAAVRVDRGNALYRRGKALGDASALAIYDQAIAAHLEAIEIEPGLVTAHYNMGLVLLERGRLEAAVAAFRAAISLRPDYAEAHCNLGHCLSDIGCFEEAEAACRRALSLDPGLAEAQSTLGNVFTGQGRLQEAEAAYRRAVELNPDLAGGHCNLGVALFRQGRSAEAMAAYEHALRLSPELADAHWNRALVLLQRGALAEGWAEYEWRLRRSRRMRQDAGRTLPLWTGEPLSGGAVLLHAEQGFGDAIQCARFVARAAARAPVVLQASRSLHALFATLPDAPPMIAEDAPDPPQAVCRLPLFSLPRLFAPTEAEVATERPYLAADPALAAAWAARLGDIVPGLLEAGLLEAGLLRVGVVWSGNLGSEVELGRSIPLAAFAPLDRPGVRLVSLQKGDGVAQLDRLPAALRVDRLGPDYDAGDFAVTAAVIANLDLVVCCDTAVAHLAGALGKPVWLAVNAVADWRWQLGRTDSPWYPSLRVHRQSRPGDWDGLFTAMAADLAAFGR